MMHCVHVQLDGDCTCSHTELDQLIPAGTTDCDTESSKHDVPTTVAKSGDQFPPPYEEGTIQIYIQLATKLPNA